MKCTPEEYAFHQRVLARDPVAFSQLAEWLYASLVRDTGRRARSRSSVAVDMMLVEEAVGEALLKYNDAPERYDPEQATLHTYLVMAAYRDFQNATSKERRHAQRQATLVGDDSAEIDVPDGRSELDNLLNRISVEEWWSLVESTFSEPADRQLVIMLANGVRATESYARVLGITGLPAEEQAREVKRAKDRVLKRLKRLGESHDGRT
ncbi:MAG: hypothetical protein QOH93_3575 [Chloroflexia bacterium]|nr:hypothetical protein [Chloroflexia bacterium]